MCVSHLLLYCCADCRISRIHACKGFGFVRLDRLPLSLVVEDFALFVYLYCLCTEILLLFEMLISFFKKKRGGYNRRALIEPNRNSFFFHFFFFTSSFHFLSCQIVYASSLDGISPSSKQSFKKSSLTMWTPFAFAF